MNRLSLSNPTLRFVQVQDADSRVPHWTYIVRSDKGEYQAWDYAENLEPVTDFDSFFWGNNIFHEFLENG